VIVITVRLGGAADFGSTAHVHHAFLRGHDDEAIKWVQYLQDRLGPLVWTYQTFLRKRWVCPECHDIMEV
jgi:hypothetical protein